MNASFVNWITSQLLICVMLTTLSLTAVAEAKKPNVQQHYTFDLPQQSVADSLNDLATQTGAQFLFPFQLAQSKTAKPIIGHFTLLEATAKLLQNTGLKSDLVDGVLTISPADDAGTSGNQNHKGKSMNITTKKTLLATMVGLFAVSGVGTTVAQDGNDAATDQRQLDEIIVTAQKREQRLIDVPMSVAAISGDELSAKGINSFAELALTVPGLSAQDTGSNQRRITIRGVGNTFGVASLVGVYVDELSVTSFSDSQLDIKLYDLDRVEVLRGPQGTLYGEGSAGGTIRYITKRPDLEQNEGLLGFTLSSTQGGDASHSVEGMVNIPLVEDKLALRLSGVYEDNGGWIDQPREGLSEINDSELLNVRVKALWVPTDDLDVDLFANIHRNETGLPNLGEDEDGNYNQAAISTATPSFDDDYEIYGVTLNYDFGWAALVSASSYVSGDKEGDSLGRPQPFLPPPAPDLEIFNNLISYEAEVFTQEIRLSSVGADSLDWSVGAFYRDSDLESIIDFEIYNFPGVPVIPQYSLRDNSSQSWAAFGNVSYTVGDYELGAGIRYFEDDREFYDGSTNQEDTFDSVNPRIYAKYALNDDANIYFNIAKGFRSGGFNSLDEPSYDSESIWSYEVGTKIALMDGRMDIELAAFYSDYEDIQVVGFLPPPKDLLNITSNLGEATIKGFDWLVSFQATEKIIVGFSGEIVDTEVGEVLISEGSHAEGDQLDLVPEYSFSAWADYRFQWSETMPGYARLDYSEQGRSETRNRGLGPQLYSESDVIEMLNASVNLTNEGWLLTVFAKNILNDRGVITPLQASGLSPRSRPRTFGVEATYSF